MPDIDITRYVVSPDVSCREEGPDGALLFNPDTNDVLVINTTGLLIWEALADPRTQEEVTAALIEQCNNIPGEQVSQDVAEFVDQMIGKGFVRVYQGAIA